MVVRVILIQQPSKLSSCKGLPKPKISSDANRSSLTCHLCRQVETPSPGFPLASRLRLGFCEHQSGTATRIFAAAPHLLTLHRQSQEGYSEGPPQARASQATYSTVQQHSRSALAPLRIVHHAYPLTYWSVLDRTALYITVLYCTALPLRVVHACISTNVHFPRSSSLSKSLSRTDTTSEGRPARNGKERVELNSADAPPSAQHQTRGANAEYL